MVGRKCLAVAVLSFGCLAGPAVADSVRLISRAAPDLPSATADDESRTYGSIFGPVDSLPAGGFLSADGRYLVFTSTAENLVAGLTLSTVHFDQIYLHDRIAGTTVLVTRSAADAAVTCNGASENPRISADGRYVAFLSSATDVVSGQVDPASDTSDLFLFDRVTGTNSLVSRAAGTTVTADGADEFDLSADGSWIAFSSIGDNLVPGQGPSSARHVFLFDRAAGTSTLVSHTAASATTPGNGFSERPSLSADGSFLAYHSTAANLVTGQVDMATWDVFLYDRALGQTVLVSRSSASPTTTGDRLSQTADVSADGSHVAFVSEATNLVAGQSGPAGANVFLYRRADASVTLVSHATAGAQQGGSGRSSRPVISQDGSYVAFVSYAGDLVSPLHPSKYPHVFLFQQSDGALTRMSDVTAPGASLQISAWSPWINADGSRVAFQQRSELVDDPSPAFDSHIYIYNRASGTRTLVSHSMVSPSTPGNSISLGPVLSADGEVVAFASYATNLIEHDFNVQLDVFLYSRGTGMITAATLAGEPSQTVASRNLMPAISDDGNVVAFYSAAPNLASGQVDTNRGDDVFVWSRTGGAARLVSRKAGTLSTAAAGASVNPVLSADGDWVLYQTSAGDLVPGQTAAAPSQLALSERATGATVLVSHVAGAPATPSPGTLHTVRLPAISRDGRWVAFSGSFTGLLPGPALDGQLNAFLYDRLMDSTVLVSHASGAPTTSANSFSVGVDLSADGRFLAFTSAASNLIAGLSDTNGQGDVFLYDRDTGALTLVSRKAGFPATTANGTSDFPKLSADGRWISFTSTATDLVTGQIDSGGARDVFLYDRITGALSLVSHAVSNPAQAVGPAGEASQHDMSADGRFVVFGSKAGNVTAGVFPNPGSSNQVFLYDRTTGQNVLVSHTAAAPANAGNNESATPVISADGRFVVFTSTSTNHVAGATDAFLSDDVFLYERGTGAIELLSRSDAFPLVAEGGLGDVISADGGQIVFRTTASLVPEDDNGHLLNNPSDLYLYENLLPATDFHSLVLCRALDTRQPADGPALVSGVRQLFTVPGACGVPATAKAVVLNVTVTQATGGGYLKLHAGNASSPTSTVNFAANQTRSNNAAVRLSTNGDGTIAITPVLAGGGTVHVILDVEGYYE